MSELKDKIRTALNEARILVLGIEVLVGFEYEAAFQKNFDKLPDASQGLKVVSLLLLLLALGLTMAPAAYHQIADHGEDAPDSLGFITTMVGIALLPFALGFGGDIYVATEQVAGTGAGIAAAIAAILLALAFWYGIEIALRRPKPQEQPEGVQQKDEKSVGGSSMQPNEQSTKLKDKVELVLTETRVVLPGTQALIGFQVIIMLTDAFAKLPDSMKYLHLISLFAVAISMIMLMAPAAFHRLADRGQTTERLHSFASAMVVGSMFFFGLGMAGDLYVVVNLISGSSTFAGISSVGMLVLFFALWFAYPLLRRSASQSGDFAQGKEQDVQPVDRPA